MNAEDFDQIRDLLLRTRATLDGIRGCCQFQPGTTPADVRLLLDETEEALGDLIRTVQQRAYVAWKTRNPDHPSHTAPPIRWPQPTRVPDGTDLVRLDLNGRAPDRQQPSPSGRWAQENPRRRSHG